MTEEILDLTTVDDLMPLNAKVAVRVCTRDTPTETCKFALNRIKNMRPSWDIATVPNKYDVAMGRCTAIANVRASAFDYVILVDDDVGPLDPVVNLPAHEKPVVGGIVPTWREGLFFWNAFHMAQDYKSIYSITAKGPRGGLEEVYAVGTAILCLRRDVFDNPDLDPVFAFKTKADGTLCHILGGEDINFCRKMHEIGVPVLIDHAVQGEHFSRINFLETLLQGKKYAPNNPDHCFPSIFAFDLGKLPQHELDHAAEYLARRRRREERLVGRDGGAVPQGAV